MQREIKFRARWRDTGKLIPDFTQEYLIDACNDEIFIVEQFTGIKDKNNKEIYEGDIVEIELVDKEKWVVIFENGCFQLKKGDYGRASLSHYVNSKCCEIVGNIFQNNPKI